MLSAPLLVMIYDKSPETYKFGINYASVVQSSDFVLAAMDMCLLQTRFSLIWSGTHSFLTRLKIYSFMEPHSFGCSNLIDTSLNYMALVMNSHSLQGCESSAFVGHV